MHATGRFLLPASLVKRSRALPLDLKSIDDGVFEGYASLFNREDLGHDVIAPGAFRESLRNRGVARIKMLFQHDPAEPIGVWEDIREDARGLYVRGRLMTAVAKAREVLVLMRAGALDGLSIGFKALKGRRDSLTGVRRLEKVDLWEISVVTFPMLPGARVESVKARPFGWAAPTERDFERWLTRDAGLTRMEARAVMRSGYYGLKALRDAGRTFDDDAVLASRLREAARMFSTLSHTPIDICDRICARG
jgi:HK97 family phage prohead protease